MNFTPFYKSQQQFNNYRKENGNFKQCQFQAVITKDKIAIESWSYLRKYNRKEIMTTILVILYSNGGGFDLYKTAGKDALNNRFDDA